MCCPDMILKENQHGSVFKEIENRIFIVLEYFFAPTQAIAPSNVHEAVYCVTYIAALLTR